MAEPLANDRLDGATVNVGCVGCPHMRHCGGFMRRGNAWNCLDLCCGSPEMCDRVCPRRVAEFPIDLVDVRGFGLENVGALGVDAKGLDLPRYIPVIHGGSGRRSLLNVPWAALPINRVCTRKRKRRYRVRFGSKGECLGSFRLGLGTRLLFLGIGKDVHLERYWAERREAGIPRLLAAAGFELAVALNFSFFLDEPRMQHLANRKRSLIVASEFAAEGIQPVVYLHALSLGDWRILSAFLAERPEITIVCKEFQTGGVGCDHRGKIRRVAEMQQRLGRGLHLVAVGGARFVDEIRRCGIASWTIVDSTPYMKAMHRRRAVLGDGRIRWASAHEAPLDDLLAKNIAAYERHLSNAALAATSAA